MVGLFATWPVFHEMLFQILEIACSLLSPLASHSLGHQLHGVHHGEDRGGRLLVPHHPRREAELVKVRVHLRRRRDRLQHQPAHVLVRDLREGEKRGVSRFPGLANGNAWRDTCKWDKNIIFIFVLPLTLTGPFWCGCKAACNK